MQRTAKGNWFLTDAEHASLKRLITQCSDRISRLENDGDFLGWEHYRALHMWEALLTGEDTNNLYDFVGDEEESEGYGIEAQTVKVWLEQYGRKAGEEDAEEY